MNFRVWLQQKWFDHVSETEVWTGKIPNYGQKEYLQKNKWWLKRQYRMLFSPVDKKQHSS